MMLLFGTVGLDATIHAALVGGVWAAFCRRHGVRPRRLQTVALLVAIFAALDFLWVPFYVWAELSVSVGNPEFAEFLGGRTFLATSFVVPGFLDVAVWLLQSLVAVIVGPMLVPAEAG